MLDGDARSTITLRMQCGARDAAARCSEMQQRDAAAQMRTTNEPRRCYVMKKFENPPPHDTCNAPFKGPAPGRPQHPAPHKHTPQGTLSRGFVDVPFIYQRAFVLVASAAHPIALGHFDCMLIACSMGMLDPRSHCACQDVAREMQRDAAARCSGADENDQRTPMLS
jgi:hypothetical protein